MLRRFVRILLVGCFLLAGISLGDRPSSARAEINKLIPFSAHLRSASTGLSVPDGSYQVTFGIYSASTGGNALWSEVQNISVVGGLLTATLGSVEAFPASLTFNNAPYYLGVSVGGEDEMSPRQEIGSVPSAFNASTINGLRPGTSANSVLLLDDSGSISIQGGATLGGSLSVGGGLGLGGALSVGNGVSIGGGATVGGGLGVGGSATVGGTLGVDSNVTVGGGLSVGSSILPTTAGVNLGSSVNHFATLYVDSLAAGSTTVNGTSSVAFTVDTDQVTDNTDLSSLRFYLGPSSNTYAALQWNGPANRFDLLSNQSTGAFADLKLNNLLTGSAVLSLPTSSDTLVARTSTDTLSNKTLTNPIINGTVGTVSGLTLPATTFSGAITGSGNPNLAGLGTVNGQTLSAASSFTGTLTTANTLTISNGGLQVQSGGASIAGNTSIAGTLSGLTGLTVASGGATIGGDIALSGNLVPTGGTSSVGTAGNHFNNGFFDSLTVNNLTANSSGGNFSGPVSITSTSSPQLAVKYDASNYFSATVSNQGLTTLGATGSASGFLFNGPVTANSLQSSSASISGGSINSTPVGATLPSSGAFTSLSSSSGLTIAGGGAGITGNLNVVGNLTVSGTFSGTFTGSIADSSLTANVALLNRTNQSFTGNNSFGGSLSVAGSGTALSVTNGASIGANLAVGGTINGATVTGGTVSGGSLTGGSVSGGALTGTSLSGTGNFTLTGGAAASQTLTLSSTSDATKGNIQFFTSANTLSSAGDFNLGSSKLTLAGATGNLAIAGTFNGNGNFSVNTNKFSVAATSGNTVVGGTLSVAGSSNVAGVIATGSVAADSLAITNGASVGGNLTVLGSATSVAGLTATGNATLGTSSANSLVVNAALGSNLIPSADSVYNLGSTTNRFANFYAANAYFDTVTVQNTNSPNFIINSANATADTQDSSLQFSRGTSTPNATIAWDSVAKRFSLNEDLLAQGSTTLGDAATDSTTIRGAVSLYDSSINYKLLFGSGTDTALYRSGASTLASDADLVLNSVAAATSGAPAKDSRKQIFQGSYWNGSVPVAATGGIFLNTVDGTPTYGLALQTANTTRVFVNQSGNVGIGTQTPTHALEVIGTISSTGAANFGSSLAAAGTITAGTGLVVTSGGAAVSGGLNNNIGGITNAGAIAGVTSLTASGTIQGGTVTDGTASLNGGALSGVTTLTTSSTINSQTISASANFTGTVNVANGVAVAAGGINVTGNSTLSGTLGGLTGLTVVSGGVGVTGNSTIIGNLTLNGNLLESGSHDIGASGNRVANAYVTNLDVTNLTAGASATSFGGAVAITSTSSPQLAVRYDGSNYGTVGVSAAGAVTFDGSTGATYAFAKSLTANTFASSGVAITGGSINATSIGATTRSSGAFTSLAANSGLTVSAGGIAVTGSSTISGSLGGITGLSVASGGETITAGNLAVSSGSITASGTVNGVTLSGGTVSGGTLSGGSYSGTALTPTNNYTIGSSSYSLTLQGNANNVYGTPAATANYGLLNVGVSATSFAAGVGAFAGNAQGTQLAMNTAGNFAGNLVDLQLSGASRFSVDASGNLLIAGTFTTSTTAGTVGYLTRSGTILSPSTAGDSIATSGNISTSGSGIITAAAGVVVTSGGASITGGVNANNGGLTNVGAIAGATTISASGLLSLGSAGSLAIQMVAPTGFTAIGSATGGGLAAGTYYYAVTASDGSNETLPALSASVTLTGATSSVALAWAASPGATSYKVYRSSSSSFTSGALLLGMATAGAVTLTDDGSSLLSAGIPPLTSGAYSVKVAGNGNTLLNGGNVGIGTANPSAQLDVTGKAPSLVTTQTTYTGANISPILVQNGYIYVGASGNIDPYALPSATTPAALAAISNASGGQSTTSLSSNGSYIAAGDSGGFTLFSANTPGVITKTARYAGGNTGLQLKGGLLAVASSGTPNLSLFNIANPANPQLLSTINDYYLHGFTLSGNYAYTLTDRNGGAEYLDIYDISNPSAPSLKSSTNLCPLNCTFGLNLESVVVSGSYLYAATNNGNNSYRIVNISNPASPVAVATVSLASRPVASVVQGRYAYVLLAGGFLQVYDVSTPSSPVLAYAVPVTGVGTKSSIAISGRVLYLTSSTGLQVFDLGGAYSQVLEAGTLDVSSASVRQDLQVGGSVAVQGGGAFGAQLLAKSFGIAGGANFVGNLLDISANSTKVLSLDQSGTLTHQVFNFQSVQQTTTAEASFVDATASANSNSSWNLFKTSGALNDRTYFGMATPAQALNFVNKTSGTGGAVSWQVWLFSGSWATISGGSDGTSSLTSSGVVSWTNAMTQTAVNGITAYWIRATVTTAETAQANGIVSIANPGSGMVGELIQSSAAASGAFSSSGTVLGMNTTAGFAGNLLDLGVGGTSLFKVSAAGRTYSDGGFLSGGATSTGRYGASALGFTSSASGDTSMAFGDTASASGFDTVAIGTHSGAAGNNSIAIGHLAIANGLDGIALGNAYTSLLRSAVTVGNGQTTSVTRGGASYAGSGTVTVSGTTVTGSSTTFTNDFTVGDRITISAISYTVTAIASNTSLTINTSVTVSGGTAYTVVPMIFKLQDSSLATQLLVTDQGNIGIGTVTPAAKLDVVGSVKISGSLTVGGGISTNLASKVADYTATSSDSIIIADSTSGLVTITLPTAVGIAGRQYTIKKTDASANAVNVATTSAQTVDGGAPYVLSARYKYVTVVSDGANWQIIANN